MHHSGAGVGELLKSEPCHQLPDAAAGVPCLLLRGNVLVSSMAAGNLLHPCTLQSPSCRGVTPWRALIVLPYYSPHPTCLNNSRLLVAVNAYLGVMQGFSLESLSVCACVCKQRGVRTAAGISSRCRPAPQRLRTVTSFRNAISSSKYIFERQAFFPP